MRRIQEKGSERKREEGKGMGERRQGTIGLDMGRRSAADVIVRRVRLRKEEDGMRKLSEFCIKIKF